MRILDSAIMQNIAEENGVVPWWRRNILELGPYKHRVIPIALLLVSLGVILIAMSLRLYAHRAPSWADVVFMWPVYKAILFWIILQTVWMLATCSTLELFIKCDLGAWWEQCLKLAAVAAFTMALVLCFAMSPHSMNGWVMLCLVGGLLLWFFDLGLLGTMLLLICSAAGGMFLLGVAFSPIEMT